MPALLNEFLWSQKIRNQEEEAPGENYPKLCISDKRDINKAGKKEQNRFPNPNGITGLAEQG